MSERYKWMSNNDITRLHAVDKYACGLIVPALCGWAVDTGIRWSGDAPPRCKRCERKVDRALGR